MNWLVRTGLNPWNEEILTHAQWNLVYLAIGLGVVFMLAHTLYVAFWPKPAGGHTAPVDPALAARVPAKVKRQVNERDLARIRHAASHYVAAAKVYRESHQS